MPWGGQRQLTPAVLPWGEEDRVFVFLLEVPADIVVLGAERWVDGQL